jgi:phosphorylase/glycogen(starch) synthase
VLPNVLDADALALPAKDVPRAEARRRVREGASRFLGEDVSGALIVFSAGRYDMGVKGFDVLVDALARVNAVPGRPVVAVLVVPAPNAGLKKDVAERLSDPTLRPQSDPGFATHALFEPGGDPLASRARDRGLSNAPGRRVRLIHVPVYLDGPDAPFGLPYAAVLQGADLTVFPSFHESWGFTPQESLALGVPTVTTDLAGFGRWARDQRLGHEDGITVLARDGRTLDEAAAALAGVLESAARAPEATAELRRRCREASGGVAEAELLRARGLAFSRALDAAAARTKGESHARSLPRAAPGAPHEPRSAPRLHALDVPSRVPAALAPLERLAQNWRWAWHEPTRALYEAIDPARAAAVQGNVLRLLRETSPEHLAALAADDGFVERARSAAKAHEAWMAEAQDGRGVPADRPVAYLCAEYALHECLPLYSGGLGVLAGDHLRAASDLNLPLVAVGLLYRKGYFRQRLEGGVEQVGSEDPVDPRQVPLAPVLAKNGAPLEIPLPLPGGTLLLRAWRAQVGRVALYLLDADHEANRPEDRPVTHALYAGDSELRLRQELVLGRGGVRLIDRLGLRPSVLHVNEGHGAFACLERIASLVREAGLTFDEARTLARLTTVFTTHTPVPAGHDRYGEDLLRRYLSDAPAWLGLSWDRFLALGASAEKPREFNLTYLAANLATFVNGVSVRHAEVSRPLVKPVGPHLLTAEVPVHAITNGVHLEEWTAPEIARLVAPNGELPTGERFGGAGGLDLAALGEARRALRIRMIERLRARLEAEGTSRGDPAWLVQQTLAGLSPKALWIGFARRFAAYKRAGLLFSDPDRLRALLEAADRPVRIVLAGKAHPRDREGSELVGRIARLARSRGLAGKVFFVAGYDLALARLLVQGTDVWLNTPRPPHEASGTSGMKAAANGGLNVSIADGWWIEGFDGQNGWTIGAPDSGSDDEARDRADAEALYRLLEDEVLPLWARRDAQGLPREWLERVRRALTTIPPRFDAARMVAEYRDRAYAPLARRRLLLEADGHAGLKDLAAARRRVREGFAAVRVLSVTVSVGGDPARKSAGDPLDVVVRVNLGSLTPEDVHVEFVLGERPANAGENGALPAGSVHDLASPVVVRLAPDGTEENGERRFTGRYDLAVPGGYGYGVRVRPRSEEAGVSPLHEPAVWA